MSSEIDFKIELREVGGTKRLAFIHDPGQGPNEVVVRLGQETMVLDIREAANAGVAMLRLLQGQVSANQPAAQLADLRPHIEFARGPVNSNGDVFRLEHEDGLHMPPAPRSRPQAARNPNDK